MDSWSKFCGKVKNKICSFHFLSMYFSPIMFELQVFLWFCESKPNWPRQLHTLCSLNSGFSIWISLVPEIFQDKFQKRHTVNHLPPQKDRARATQKLQSLWSSELSITTCLEDNHMKARAGDFAEGPPAPRTEVWQTLSFCNYFGWRMRQMARVSDTDLVYQVAVTKSICFASALFNKLFILYKKGNFGGKKNKVK